MAGVETNRNPIQVVVNYWESRSSGTDATKLALNSRLDQIMKQGITHITSFIPWQAVESDISHTLSRFLHAVAERRMSLQLIVTPEVGVHYQNSGLPKDVLARQDNQALNIDGTQVLAGLPPNAFPLPSYLAPECMKRYNAFLARMDSLLASFQRTSAESMKRVTVSLSGSFWKYYRSPKNSARFPFSGAGGDFSTQGALAYRRHLEHFFAQREFMDPASAANRWKAPALDDVNRRAFYQASEEVFRARTSQAVGRKANTANVLEMELYTPEADPSFLYSNFLQLIAEGQSDFAKYSGWVDQAAARMSVAGGVPTAPFIHWTTLGSFRLLSDPEKQFLLLKSLLLFGSQGGGLLIDEREWLSLSQNFRSRLEAFGRTMAHGELQSRNRALYLAPHLWSHVDPLWNELHTRVGTGAKLISSLELVTRERDAKMVLVDPSFIMTREALKKLTAWCRTGKMVVLPRSVYFTDGAREELEAAVANIRKIDITLNIPYRLYPFGEGKLVVYEVPQAGVANADQWKNFLTSMISLAEIQPHCRLSDSRLDAIPLEITSETASRFGGQMGGDSKGTFLGLFILNPSPRPVTADILFPTDVEVSDLATALSTSSRSETATAHAQAQGQKPAQVQDRPRESLPAHRFSLEVPPCGVLSLCVEGTRLTEERMAERERQEAVMHADITAANAMEAARAQLPGFDSGSDMDKVIDWN